MFYHEYKGGGRKAMGWAAIAYVVLTLCTVLYVPGMESENENASDIQLLCRFKWKCFLKSVMRKIGRFSCASWAAMCVSCVA